MESKQQGAEILAQIDWWLPSHWRGSPAVRQGRMGTRGEVTSGGLRLDVFVARELLRVGRRQAQQLIDAGAVRVNGRRARKGVVLESGDVVECELGIEELSMEALPDPGLELQVLFEDDDFVVVNKLAGIPSHPLQSGEVGAIANALLAKYPAMRGVGYSSREPGLVHRLDVGTSGVLLAAKHREAFEELRDQLRGGAMMKQYVALCSDAPEWRGAILGAIEPSSSSRRKMQICGEPVMWRRGEPQPHVDGDLAVTWLLASEPFEVCRADELPLRSSLFAVTVGAHVAKRHQVRVHLAAVGLPLVGDFLYGGFTRDGISHHCLHASLIEFGARNGEMITVRAPLPELWSEVASYFFPVTSR